MHGRGYRWPTPAFRRHGSFGAVNEPPFVAYLDAQPEPQRSTLAAVAASLRSLLPDAEASISYAMPAFKIDGTAVAGFAGFQHHCSYFPHSGAVIPQHMAELAAFEADAGTLRFPIDKPLPLGLLRSLVATRLRLESEHPPRAGKVRSFYDNGYLQSKGGMRNGEMHGEWAWYRKDGSLMRTGTFRNGAKVGTWRTFTRDGAVAKETTC